ncbi:DNA dC-_dU-editing enzyme APOBEC-3C isoform X2 [Aotus nancymaae]|uniref:DNA dC->dU-editing enzyme APOBEC-3C isoform X2 n=1 Tax=Aotus nancymaae TaxID=37293 RepID=UPI0030FEA9B2
MREAQSPGPSREWDSVSISPEDPGPLCIGRFLSCAFRHPMDAMYPGIFYFHFRNLRKAYGRNETWLCFTVEEMCFLSWFCHNMLSPNKDYEVTWYASWSPCPECAGQVAEFLARHRNVRLTIFTARLYYFWNPGFQQGLRRLSQEGASVLIMGYEDFEYCWEIFVYNNGQTFKPWKRLQDNSLSLDRTLQEILQRGVSLGLPVWLL